MKKNTLTFIALTLTLFIFCAVVSAEKAYIVSLTSVEGSVLFDTITVSDVEVGSAQIIDSAYSIELLNQQNNVEYATSAKMEKTGKYNIFLPFKQDAKTILIKTPSGEKFLEYSVEEFSKPAEKPSQNSTELKIAELKNNSVQKPPVKMIDKTNMQTPATSKSEIKSGTDNDLKDSQESQSRDLVAQEKPKKSDSDFLPYVFILLGVVALIGGVLFLIVYFGKKQETEEDTYLENSIRVWLRQGYQVPMIKQTLMNQGKDAQKVDAMIQKIFKGQ